MGNQQFRLAWFCTAVTAMLLGASAARADALRNQPPGAFGWARGGGKIAQVDDASAVAINPANLADLDGATVLVSPAFDYITTDYHSPNGASDATREPLKFLPAMFAAAPIEDTNLTWGVGLSVPFGQSVEYDDDFSFRYLSPHFSELVVLNLNPSLAYKVNDQLSIGGGVDIAWSQLTLRQSYPWASLSGNAGDPDGSMHFKGDGYGFGVNLGVTWQIDARQRLAATYRSSMKIDYGGDFTIDNIPAAGTGLGVTPKSRFKTSIDYPAIAALGYGIKLSDQFRIEFDLEWLKWSNVKQLNLDVGNDAVIFPSTVVPEDWKNTYTAGVGWDWVFAPGRVLRGGYWYLQNPIPSNTQQPNITESTEHILTIGYGIYDAHHKFDIAYGYVYYPNRRVSDSFNPAFNGTWHKEAQILVFSYSYLFH